MILYLSSATAYSVYDDLLEKKIIKSGYQAQKFNHTLIKGLSASDKVICVSALPYEDVKVGPIFFASENCEFHCVGNARGIFRKIKRLFSVKRLSERIIKKQRPDFILCDAVLAPASIAAVKLGKKYKIPTIAIVTDIPEAFVQSGMGGLTGKIVSGYMKKYDGYVLLTERMNAAVNPCAKPYLVVEGICDPVLDIAQIPTDKETIVYTGSLWKDDAGLEYFTRGFLDADIPDTELLFYGTGDFVPELEKISKAHKNVRYMGLVPNSEIVKVQKSASLLVNPRPTDKKFTEYSFPSKTLEYMSSGTPVLMTKLKGVPDEYFDFVYTIDEETSSGVEKALKEFFAIPKDVRNDFGKRAKEFVDTEKNAVVQSKKILDFLKGNFY